MAKADTTPQEQSVVAPPDKRSSLSAITDFFLRRREASIFLIAVVLLICFQVANDNFLTLGNVKTLAEYTAETAIIAVGEVMILIMGEIDLSVGFTYALAPFIMYIAYSNGLPLFVGIILALLGSALIGLINGAVVVFFRVPSFIATLGAYFYLNGLTLTISNAFPNTTPDVGTFWNGVLGNNIYWESLWAVLFIVIMQLVLSRTRWGLHTIAVGSNLIGAGEVGINVNLIKLRNFTLASLLAGFAGILLAFRVTSIDPSAGGANIMFEAVSGAVIGGTALQGGSGTIVGAFLGTLVLQILKDGLTLVGVSAFTFDIILGVVIVIAMILNIRLQILRRGGNQ
ncbi:ABC transporter permease [Dictyobacter kobayashii]|uniref:Sugar ABC transporter permease n=1 Tax=Dictyobacter kobayashii TaxID=2014872 RepID=A0A402APT5_9CHLR|nr:ABC transporter permease [Dictyobacter kobayashii]GCE21127.1 sugar ABC transporter permease [Dictyobacter kobayashii]